ncbi:hypothetical protein AERO9AM_50300 [Aeromicrobium sp. 9AM]|nr:hypothetical protein AERO9AM_50300 [Aeromicrobium sp. 9AM]
MPRDLASVRRARRSHPRTAACVRLDDRRRGRRTERIGQDEPRRRAGRCGGRERAAPGGSLPGLARSRRDSSDGARRARVCCGGRRGHGRPVGLGRGPTRRASARTSRASPHPRRRRQWVGGDTTVPQPADLGRGTHGRTEAARLGAGRWCVCAVLGHLGGTGGGSLLGRGDPPPCRRHRAHRRLIQSAHVARCMSLPQGFADVTQLARVSAFQAECCEFESRRPLRPEGARPVVETRWAPSSRRRRHSRDRRPLHPVT